MAAAVELFGVPGSGKTTFRRNLASELAARGYTVADVSVVHIEARSGTAKWLARFSLLVRFRRPLFWSARILITSPRSLGQKLDGLRFVAVTLERMAAVRSDQSNAVYIVEEGPLQRLFLLLVEANGVRSDGSRTAYVDRMPFGDVLVHVQAAPAIAVERLAARDRRLPPRLAGLDFIEATELLGRGDTLLRTTAEEILSARPGRGRGAGLLAVDPVQTHVAEFTDTLIPMLDRTLDSWTPG